MSAPQQQQPQPPPDRRPLSARLGIKLELLQPSSSQESSEGEGRLPPSLRSDGSTAAVGGPPAAASAASAGAAAAAASSTAAAGGGGQQQGHGHHHHHRRAGPGAGHSRLDEGAAAAASRQVVERLRAAGVNLLALDFDMTVLDIHTGGRWTGKAQELAQHVRPFFRCLITEAGRQGIHMAIVTFSPQTDMIREVLRERFGHELAMQIPVRGEDGSWTYLGDGSHKGKQGHMASAVEELQGRFPSTDITRASTVLVDDDRQNIEVALKAGVRAFWLDPRRPDDVIQHLLQISSASSASAVSGGVGGASR